MESHKKPRSAESAGGISALIVDDEQGAINSLWQMIREYCPQIQDLHTARTVGEAIATAAAVQPDLVFLDIEMPPLGSGFDFLSRCPYQGFGVIFTSAYPQYAIRAINTIQPWAYLVKPFSVGELKRAVEVALQKIGQARASGEPAGPPPGIVLPDSRKGSIILRAEEILFCKAEGSFTAFYVRNSPKPRRVMASGHLKEFETRLPAPLFCRTHHSYLLNLMYVKRVERTGRNGIIYLQDSELTVDISVSRMEQVMLQIKKYLESNGAVH